MNIYVPRCYSFRGDIFLLFDNWSADAQPFCLVTAPSVHKIGGNKSETLQARQPYPHITLFQKLLPL